MLKQENSSLKDQIENMNTTNLELKEMNSKLAMNIAEISIEVKKLQKWK